MQSWDQVHIPIRGLALFCNFLFTFPLLVESLTPSEHTQHHSREERGNGGSRGLVKEEGREAGSEERKEGSAKKWLKQEVRK